MFHGNTAADGVLQTVSTVTKGAELLTTISGENFEEGPILCRICGQVLAPIEIECPMCGSPAPAAPTPQSAHDRLMGLARSMPGIARNAVGIDSLCQQFLRVVVGATRAICGVVWDLEAKRRWVYGDVGSLPEDLDVNYTGFLEQAALYKEGQVLRVDDPGNVSDFMLVVRPFFTEAIPSGVIELMQRADAPREAEAGYLMFLDQMATYFEDSPVLGSNSDRTN